MPKFALSVPWLGIVFAAAMTLACIGCDSERTSTPSAVSTGGSSQADSLAATGITTSAAKPKPRPGTKTKVLARAGDRSYDRTFDDLRFEMTVGDEFKRSILTKEIEALHGQKIRIRGYILPTPQNHGIKQFVLVRDNQECCFGPGAALYDCILVEMKSGKTADFTIRPIAIEGLFEIREFVIGGKHLAIYHVDAESAG